MAKIMAAVACSRRNFQQLSSLMSSTKIPSLDLFRPNSRWYSETFDQDNNGDVRIDTDSVRKVVKEFSFGQSLWHKLDGMCNSADAILNSKSCGLWPLPAFINHSCCPNAARLEVGRALFVHAARDIGEGEEITLPYFDALVPFHARQEICQRWGFQCQCRRCSSERGSQKAFRRINEQFNFLHDKAFREINAAAEAGEVPGPLPACASFGQLAVRLQAEGSASADTLLRASYALAYLAGMPSSDFFEDFMQTVPPWEDLVSCLHETVPGHWRSLIMQCGEVMELRQYLESSAVVRDEGPLRVVREVAYKLCRSTFGNQRAEVFEALIAQASSMRPF
ncbi:uncharacterized protein LOC112342764 [Selaginella moellendorffii]|uniref:uncharacterized protein LOC112342764 n=1 Tax=Selaginella moellendorffii TaxID=88036 RepID=UPI000D1CF482|nr:uncharacterized protein LOC112342764 [Selaginella moellendorffii]|eukprot:XP_024520831.1 uncharacterized protein LOC112342764 [Selaginella moellendorffii]